MAEGHRAVVRKMLFNQHVAVEAAHLRDGEDADAAERARRHGQHLALRDIGLQPAVGRALQAVERDVPRGDVAFERAAGEIRLVPVFQQAVLDELVLDGAFREPAQRRVAAVEAHEGVAVGIAVFSPDVAVVQVLRHAVVDVQQGDRAVRHAGADVFADRAVDVGLACDGDAAARQPAVDVARLKAELLRERRPAFVGEGHVPARTRVLLCPVEQGQLELREARQQVGVGVARRAELLRHVVRDAGDAFVPLVRAVGDQKVQLGIFLDFDSQVVQRLDGRVAGEKVLRARAEGDDLQRFEPDGRARGGDELPNHLRNLIGRADRVFRYHGRDVAQPQVIRAVEHAAVGVAPAVYQVLAAFLRCGGVQHRPVKMLGELRFGRFRPEIAEEHDQRVAPRPFHFIGGAQHVRLVFHDGLRLVQLRAVPAARFCDGPPALFRERLHETVAAHGDDCRPDFRNVFQHDGFSFPDFVCFMSGSSISERRRT